MCAINRDAVAASGMTRVKIETPRSSPPSSRALEDVLRPKRKALAALVRSPALSSGDVDAALSELTEAAVEVLRVERASVWRLDAQKSRIECVELYERSTKRHTRGQSLSRDAAPAYFRALDEERSIAAADANEDPRTCEFRKGYFDVHGVGALLDAPVFVGGSLVGVVCHEHVGARREWRLWEELVASTLADFVALVLATSERMASEKALREYRDHLERLVEERTAKLRETEAGFRNLFEAAPIPMLLMRAADERLLMTNERAEAVFPIDVFPVADSHTKLSEHFWVQPDDRARFLEAVAHERRVDRFEAPLTTKNGVIFGELAVQRVMHESQDALLVGVHDVTRQHRAEAILRRSNETLLKLFAAAPVPFLLVTAEGGVIRGCNPRAAELFETTVPRMIDVPVATFYADDHARKAFVAAAATDTVDGFTTELKTARGRSFWALLSAQTVELDGQMLLMVGISDVTKQKRIEEELRDLATRDSLTTLFNRRHFVEVADNELARADRYGQSVSMALLDVDRFKAINDGFGHSVGDEVLRRLADRTRRELRQIDVVARIGGEEFAILFPETGEVAAERVATRLRLALRTESFATPRGPAHFTVSIGLVERRMKESLDALLGRADDAMYKAKEGGRDRVVVGH